MKETVPGFNHFSFTRDSITTFACPMPFSVISNFRNLMSIWGFGSGNHGEQTGKVLIEFEKILLQEQPDLVIVVGDVNSTTWPAPLRP